MSPRRRTTSSRSSRTTALAARATTLALLAAAALVAGPSGGQVAPDGPPNTPDGAPAAAPKSLLPDSFAPILPPPVVAAAPLPVAPEAAPVEAAKAADAPPPPAAGPTIDRVGPLTPALGGYGDTAFAGSDGRFVGAVLRRLTTPVASRWGHIFLRRALLTPAPTPAGTSDGDWVADRVRVLLAMGEVDAAKSLVDNLAIDRMTPRLIRAAGQADLMAGDVPGLCPLADVGGAVSDDPLWPLAGAMCAAIAGDDVAAAGQFEALRGHGRNHDNAPVDRFDLQLGERIATVSLGSGRAANLDWDSVAAITPFRFGIAAAVGVPVPLSRLTDLAAATRGTSWGWVLRAPSQTAEARAAALPAAAVIGIASADDLVGGIAAAAADLDRSALDASPAGQLRDAYAASTLAARAAAIRDLVAGPDRYAALIETGVAAARLPVDRALAADAPDLIAAMLAVGLEDRAARWWPVVAAADDAAAREAWALLAVGANGGIAVSPTRFSAWAKDVSPHRAALFLAALDGLGAARGAEWDRLRTAAGLTGAVNSWTRAIDTAAAGRRTGEVAILSATGLQTTWRGVPPAHLRHIVAAWLAAGRGHEARMLAAEAVTRG